MKDVEIFEQELIGKSKKKVGKVAILRGGLSSDRPISHMNEAVSKYVGQTGYNEFVEITLDNPYLRVVVSGINELEFKKFDKQSLK